MGAWCFTFFPAGNSPARVVQLNLAGHAANSCQSIRNNFSFLTEFRPWGGLAGNFRLRGRALARPIPRPNLPTQG